MAARAGRVVFQLILEGIPSTQANIIISEGVAKCGRPLMTQHMIARRDQHQPVFGKRKGLKFFCRIDLVPDDADFSYVSGDSAHDFPAGTLLQIDVDLGMLRQECSQSSGNKLGGRSGIGEQAHAAPEAVGILRQFPAHPFQLLNDQLCVVNESCARWRRANATAVPFKERCAEALFHQPNAFAGRCQRHPRPRGTMRDTCSLDHKQKQTQIDQIEAHGSFHEQLVPSALP